MKKMYLGCVAFSMLLTTNANAYEKSYDQRLKDLESEIKQLKVETKKNSKKVRAINKEAYFAACMVCW